MKRQLRFGDNEENVADESYRFGDNKENVADGDVLFVQS